MLSCTTSPAMRVDRSARGGALSEESLDRAHGAFDRRKVVRLEVAEKPLDRVDAHGAPARKRAQSLGRRVDAYDSRVVAVGDLARDTGSLHVAYEPAHGRRTHLLGGGELAERFSAAHQDRERRKLGRRDAGERVRPPRTPQQVDRGGVEAIGDVALVASTCAPRHTVILVSKAN